jgi:hypothetical protein
VFEPFTAVREPSPKDMFIPVTDKSKYRDCGSLIIKGDHFFMDRILRTKRGVLRFKYFPNRNKN